MRPVVMSVAGSDSGGGAGIQADLRTISRLGGFGTTAITALTAQNLEGVRDVHGVPTDHVRQQLAAVMEGFTVTAAKTGMLWSAATIDEVMRAVDASGFPWVVDPVMVATSGARLLQDDAVQRYRAELIPQAAIVTPNLDEAAVLLERDRIPDDAHIDAAQELAHRFGVSTLVKGGHRQGEIIDVLVHEGQVYPFRSERHVLNTHGSGCALSAAIATRLAHGDDMVSAVRRGLAFLQRSAANPHDVALEVSLLGLENEPPGESV